LANGETTRSDIVRNNRGNEEPGNNKKNVYTDKATAEKTELGMKCDDQGYCKRSQAIDIRPIYHADFFAD
jgi:hypothetical protein